MILKRVRVQNFRAIRDAEVHFGRHTSILGGNGAGKSTILRAIDRFYAPATNVEGDDFFGRQLDQPIKITLTFHNFNAEELARFGERIRNNEMSVTRIFEAGGGRNNGRYFGETLQYPPFAAIRALEGATPRRTEFNALAPTLGLQNASNAMEVQSRMDEWERNHADRCEARTDDGQFFGFTNVARGNLQKSTSFVFIPAVRDASADSMDARGAVIAKLMELVVRNAVQRRDDVRRFQERVTGEFRALVDPANLPELGGLADVLSETLRAFYAQAGVALRWQAPEEFAIPLPKADVLLDEDGFEGPVERKGHGLQRAFIVTLLQHLASAGAADFAAAEDAEGEQGEGQIREPYVLPGLILAIEEPELYQHPTKQRHFAKVLKKLSDGSLQGVADQTQVMFASHSPLFVSLDRFDEVWLARRAATVTGDMKECQFTNSTLDQVAALIETANEEPPGTFTADALRQRLHIIGPEIAEGFFADMVVLVEGVGDKAALAAAATLEEYDFEAAGIAVLCANGKNNLARPTAIFRELNIPLYVVFDCDEASGPTARPNRALQRILGERDVQDSRFKVGDDYACFRVRLEAQLKNDLTDALYDQLVADIQRDFAIKREDVLKTPYGMAELLRRANDRGHRCHALHEIVNKIRERRARPL
ncbi:MAG: AAA family ATPase [Pseudomonadota bacterium]